MEPRKRRWNETKSLVRLNHRHVAVIFQTLSPLILVNRKRILFENVTPSNESMGNIKFIGKETNLFLVTSVLV